MQCLAGVWVTRQLFSAVSNVQNQRSSATPAFKGVAMSRTCHHLNSKERAASPHGTQLALANVPAVVREGVAG